MDLEHNLNRINQLITQTALANGRTSDDILLLAVSKQQPVKLITEAYNLGISQFAESYFQEALRKINLLNNLPLIWHFIGPIQSNKAKGIANHFNWVHSLNSEKIALLLDKHRPPELGSLNVCLQINLIDEPGKSGIAPAEAAELAFIVSQLPNLKLKGLMTIPPQKTDEYQHGDLFLQLNHLMLSINQQVGLSMSTLSMGMSNDFVSAIEAGATIIRIGQALFGERQK